MAKIESGVEFDKNENHKKLTKRMEKLDTKSYMFNIPSHLYKKVRRKLVDEEKHLSDVLIQYLYTYIEK